MECAHINPERLYGFFCKISLSLINSVVIVDVCVGDQQGRRYATLDLQMPRYTCISTFVRAIASRTNELTLQSDPYVRIR